MNIYAKAAETKHVLVCAFTDRIQEKNLIKYDMIMVNFVNIYAYGFINVVFMKCAQCGESRTYMAYTLYTYACVI